MRRSIRYVINLGRKPQVPYVGIEAVHDGIYADAVVGVVMRKRPWFAIFANFAPDKHQLIGKLRHYAWDEEAKDFILQE